MKEIFKRGFNVTPIYHSGFYVETEKETFLFDYYKGGFPEFDRQKHLYVFVSHKHMDHFNKEIFQIAVTRDNVTYILSKDAKMNDNYMEKMNIPKQTWNKIQYVNAGQSYSIDDLSIETFPSTDAGVAFLISCDAGSIYHAGDLHWWIWEGESKEANDKMTKQYFDAIAPLKNREIDLAFLVLDPRQEGYYTKGFDSFMRTAKVKEVYPMHYGDDASVVERFRQEECARDYIDKIK